MYKRPLPSSCLIFPLPRCCSRPRSSLKLIQQRYSGSAGRLHSGFLCAAITGLWRRKRRSWWSRAKFLFPSVFFLFPSRGRCKDAHTQVSPRLCIAHPASGCMNITMPACRVLNQPPAKCQMPVKYVDELIRIGRLGGFRKLSVRWWKRNDIQCLQRTTAVLRGKLGFYFR